MRIQWFPGHMAKTRRLIEENCALVDAVCEIADARIPAASRNPELPELTGHKPRLLVLNRVDQADAVQTAAWAASFRESGQAVVETNCRDGAGVALFLPAVRELLSERLAQNAAKGQAGRTLRIMVVGIPNVGKSSLINRLTGRRAAPVEDRPGVTRGKQWYKLENGIELLDTPGVLWPKFEDERVGLLLAYTGAIKDNVLDIETLAARLMAFLSERYRQALVDRYKVTPSDETDGMSLLVQAARRRGFLISGGEVDIERMAGVLLDEFRGGKLGRMTLECVEEFS